MIFSDEQIEELEKPLDHNKVATRSQGGKKLAYIQSWHAISEANRIFGYGKWGSRIITLDCVLDEEAKGEGRRNVSYLAIVEVVASDGTFRDTGTGHGQNMRPGDAHESASKEAVSDAEKRALRHFGNQFGLALYDKEFTNVTRDGDNRQTSEESAPSSPAESGAESTDEGQSTSSAKVDVAKANLEQSIPTQKKGIGAFIDAMQAQKHRVGADAYYQQLGLCGFEKSNEIWGKEDQKKVFDQISNLASIGFLDHLTQISDRFTLVGTAESYIAWWASLGQTPTEIPEEGEEAVIRALYEHLNEVNKGTVYRTH